MASTAAKSLRTRSVSHAPDVRLSTCPGTPQGRLEAVEVGKIPSQESEPLYGGRRPGRVTVRDIAAAKARGEKWPTLTAYDALTAGIFEEAGISALLVGDS